MTVTDWWNGSLPFVVFLFALWLLLLTWSIAGIACRACHSAGTFFHCHTHTHTHTHTDTHTHTNVLWCPVNISFGWRKTIVLMEDRQLHFDEVGLTNLSWQLPWRSRLFLRLPLAMTTVGLELVGSWRRWDLLDKIKWQLISLAWNFESRKLGIPPCVGTIHKICWICFVAIRLSLVAKVSIV